MKTEVPRNKSAKIATYYCSLLNILRENNKIIRIERTPKEDWYGQMIQCNVCHHFLNAQNLIGIY